MHDRFHSTLVCSWKENCKLITTDTCYHIGPAQIFFKTCCHCLEKLITLLVTETIINFLEIIQVQICK